MSRFLGYLWIACFLSAIVTGALGMELIAFLLGAVVIVMFFIYIIISTSTKWRGHFKKPLQNDPCGNPNIKKNFWDYM